MRAILLALVLGGCATAPPADPFESATWRVSGDGRPALCTTDEQCYRPSESTWAYFLETECQVETEEVK